MKAHNVGQNVGTQLKLHLVLKCVFLSNDRTPNHLGQHFIRAAEMAVYYIKELKTLMLKTVALWHDLTDRLDVLKYITEFLHYKQRMQIANGFQDWEIVMNFAVDELRQAHSLSLLENLWNVHIDKLFVEYKNLLIQSLQYEKSTLDTYTPMSKMTFELFVDALDIIITEQSTVSNLEQVPNTSVTSYKDLEECNFKLSDTIITCIRNTRIGYLECMVFLRNEIYKNMDGLDSLWVDKKKSDLDWQYSLKEEMMKHRMHRMKKDVLDVRATELKLHEDLLFRHAEVIREKLTLLSSLEVTDGIQPLISDFHVVAEEVSNLNTKVSPGGFPSIIAKMEEAKQKFIDLCLRCDHDNQRIFEHIDRYFEWMEQINIQLLRDIRLFSEGGNFSSDEVNSFLFVIQRLDKEMSNEKKNIDTKFTKGVVLMDMEIGNKLDKFIHYMKKTQSEILNKSNMALIVTRSKRAIKREIFNGRALLKKAEMSLSREQGWDITMLTELLEDIKNAFLFLNVPEDFQDITGLFRNRSSCSYNFNPSKSSISLGKSILKKRMASRSMVKETSRFLLFKLSVDEDEIPNTFLNKLDFILSKCKESLHTQIFNFTSQSLNRRSENNLWPTKSLNKAKAQKGTNIFLEIEPQLKEIQRQSLIAWLDMVNDALQLFNLFSNNVSVILNNEYEKFEEIWFSGMDSIENQFYDELKEFDKASQRNKAEMQRSLKTMYGHPNHKERLAALSNQAVEFCKSQTQDLKTIILYRRNQMKQLLMMFNEEKEPFIKDLNWKVSSIYENTELEQILYRMAHQLLSRPKAKKIIHILSTSRLQKNLSSKMRVLNYDMGSDSVDLNPNFKLKEDITSLIKNVILKLRLIISLRDDLADNMDCGSLEVLAQEEPRQYGLLCKSLKTSLIKTAIKVCKVGKLALAVYMEEMQSWLSNWRTDCTRLTDLFSYAQPLPSKEKMNIKMVHRRSRDSTQYPLFLGTANKSHLGAANKLRSHTTVSALTNITPATSSLPTRVTSSLI